MRSMFLADGEKHVRDALRLMLEHQADFVIVGEAGDAEGLLAQVCQRPPDVILLDWNLPGIHHQRMIRTLQDHCPSTRLVVTSVKPEQEKIAREYKIDGFLSKQIPPESFLSALIEIAAN